MLLEKDLNNTGLKKSTNLKRTLRGFVIVLTTVLIVMIYFKLHLITQHKTKIDLFTHIKYDITYSHLEIEENIIYDKKGLNSPNIENAKKRIQDLLIFPWWDEYIFKLFTPKIKKEIKEVLINLEKYEKVLKEPISGKTNIQHDLLFSLLINQLDDVHLKLLKRYNSQTKLIFYIQILLALLILLLFILQSLNLAKIKKGKKTLIKNQRGYLNKIEKSNYLLKESEKVAKTGYYTYNFDTQYWRASKSLLSLMNLKKGEYHLKNWVDIIHPDDKSILTEVLKKRLIDPEISLDVTYRVIHNLTGNIHWVHHQAQKIKKYKNGQYSEIVGVIQDITKQKKDDIDIRNFSLKLLEAQKIANVGSYTYYFNTQEWEASKLIQNLLGLEAKRYKLNMWFEIILPEDLHILKAALKNRIKNPSIPLDVVYRIKSSKDNKIHWIHQKAQKVTQNHIENNLPIIGTVQDITREKTLEKRYLNAFIEAQELEKTHFGEDLHDGISQILSAESMYISAIFRQKKTIDPKIIKLLNAIKDLNVSAINEARNISHGLMSKDLKENGVIQAIKNIANSFDIKGINFKFSCKNLKEEDINNQIKTNIYRITQEITTNIARYALPKEVTIEINKTSERKLILIIKDDGIGFDLNKLKLEGKGVGLNNIKRRVNLLQGKLILETSEGSGTKYTIEVPL